MTVSDEVLDEAGRLLRTGRLVAFPTETVYGLGGDATSPEAVARIYAAKGRPRFNPLIAHLPSLETAQAEAVFSPEAERLAARFWPGPLTLVLPRRATGTVCDLACAGLRSVALRVPGHPVTRAILEKAGRPVAAPSANRSGRLSPTTAAAVRSDLEGEVDLVVDGGPCAIGVESTIVGCLGARISLLRSGGIPQEAIEAELGRRLAAPQGPIEAPGMLASHYAPNAGLRLDASRLQAGETGLDFGGRLEGAALDLSAAADLAEAAANLYRYLRRLDESGPAIIAVASIPEHGLGAAINDRLRRAAAPRPA